MLEESNITIIAAESFKNDPSSSVKYLLKVNYSSIKIHRSGYETTYFLLAKMSLIYISVTKSS